MLRLCIRRWIIAFIIFSSFHALGQVNVLTQHNDLSRTGQNLLETTLTPALVASATFGKMFTLTVDGEVDAQPLYVSGLTVGGAIHNVVFVATEHDSVYAFDGDVGGSPLWQASLLDTLHGAPAGAVPSPSSQSGCYIPNGEYGITGTPVLDPATNTLYVVSVTLENSYPVNRLHALDISTGLEKFGAPVVIAASVSGTGLGSSNQVLAFDPGVEYLRAGLALFNGSVYVAFSSYCDLSDFHGWLFAYDAASLAQNSVFVTTPNGIGSSIWMGAGAPAVDPQNRMFVATGNGTFDPTPAASASAMDYGDDILRFDLTSGMNVTDSFTPYNQSALQMADKDLGSSAPLILPDQAGLYPHLLLQPSKAGTIYLVNRDQMGGYDTATNHVVQEVDNQVGASSGAAYWNGNVYLWPAKGSLSQFALNDGMLSPAPIAISAEMQGRGIGSTPSVSANANAGAIIWTVDWSLPAQQVLYAHDATNVANLLWSSAGNSAQDAAGLSVKFPVPTIANGRVYVGTVGQVMVYGPRSSVAQTISFGSVAAQTIGVPLPLLATASSGLAISYSSSTASVCIVSGSTVSLLTVGLCTISASQAGNGTYAPATPVSQTFNAYQPQSITFGPIANHAVGTTLALTATASSSLPVTYVSSTTSVCTVVNGTVTLIAPGLCTITASQAGNISYAAAVPVSQTFTVGAQVITFGPIPNQPVGSAITLTASTSSGLAVSYSSSTISVCTLAAGVATLVSAGTCSITASQAGNTTYAAAMPVTQSFSVLTLQSITFGPIATQTAGTPLILAATASSLLPVSYASSTASVCSVSNSTATFLASGVCIITASQAGNGAYAAAAPVSQTFNVLGTQAITFAPLPVQAAGKSVSLMATASSGLPVSYSSSTISVCTLSAGVVTLISTGSCTVTASQAGNAVYAPATAVTQTFSVLTGQTITFSPIANQTVGTPLSLSATASSLLPVGFASSAPSVCTVTGGTATFISAGVCTITVSQPGNSTYAAATPVSQTFSVLATQTITFSPISTQTVATSFTLAAAASSGLPVTYFSSTASVCTVSNGAPVLLAAGACTITASQAGNNTYAAATPVSQTFNVVAPAGPTPYVGYLAFWGVSNSGVYISWSTDILATTQVAYGTTSALGQLSPLQASLSASHGVVLTGLNSGTTYYFVAQSASAAAAVGYSTVYSFTTTGTATQPAPVISAVAATSITATSATIAWTTDEVASSQVNYGTSTSYGSSSTLDNTLVTSHSVTLTGLSAGVSYNFDVISANSSGTASTSSNNSFVTLVPAPAPALSSVTATSISDNSEMITWTTDLAASSTVNYGQTVAYGSSSAFNSSLVTSHAVTLTGLAPGTTYNFDIVSATAAGGQATSVNSTFQTTGMPVATVISSLTTTGIATNGVTITWMTDQPASSLVNYGTTTSYGFTSTPSAALVTGHSVTLSGLSANTTYDFDVVSVNASGTITTSTNSSFVTAAATGPTPQVGYLAFWGVSGSGVYISWSTDIQATTQVAYGVTNSLGQLTPLQKSLAASHGVVLTGLNSGTTYYFVAQSTSATGATGYSTIYSFTTTGTPTGTPPAISAVTPTNIASTSATVTWITDQASSSLVNYGPSTSYGSSSASNSNLVTSHSVTLTRLTAGVTYNFDVVSANSSGTSAISANYTFTTTAVSGTPAVITEVAVGSISASSATITWTTDQATTSQVSYGTTTSYGSSSPVDSSLTVSHSVTLTGLTAGTTFNFQVVSVNTGGNISISTNSAFTTSATTATPPYVGYLAYWGVNNGGATITWSTDVIASTQLAYGTTPVLGQLTPLQATLSASHGVVLTGLNPGTTYYFVAQSIGANGATGYSSTYNFTTTGTASTPAPVISSVAINAVTGASATITWTTDQPTSSQVTYGTAASYAFTSTLNSSLATSHSVVLNGLIAGTTYNFAVVSTNSANVSSTSSNYTFMTTGGTAPLPVVSSVTVTGLTSSAATIAWTTDQATSSLVNYGTTTSYGSSSSLNPALVTSHSVTLTGLTAGTAYDFDVVSVNSANASSTSSNSSFTTPVSTSPPPNVSYVAFWGVNSSGVTISWSTDMNSTTQVAYGSTTALGQVSLLQTTPAISHGVVLSGLSPGTTYYFVAQSTNASGSTGYSTQYSFTTTGSLLPAISGVTVTPVTGNMATINWTTSTPATSYVQFGPAAGSYNRYSAQTSLTTTPSCVLGYVPSGVVHYQLVSTDSYGNQTISPDATFTEP